MAATPGFTWRIVRLAAATTKVRTGAPAPSSPSSLAAQQLYRLNDAVTAILAELGWTARSDEDDERLNDAVLGLAAEFFPARGPS